MSESEIQRHLADYADGELDADLRPDVEAYLHEHPQARAEVNRWQALRSSAERGLNAESVPDELHTRLLHNLAIHQSHDKIRPWRIYAPLTAVAAALLLVIYMWPSNPVAGPAPKLLSASKLVTLYQHCALGHKHDDFGLSGKSATAATTILANNSKVGFTIHLPDLAPKGYQLQGVCMCKPGKNIRGIHAYYAKRDLPVDPAHPENVVSFFSLCSRVKLCDSRGTCCGHECPGRDARQYEVALVDEQFTVLKWDEFTCSFAVCSQLAQQELVQIIDSAPLVALNLSSPPAVASATRPIGITALIGSGLATLLMLPYRRRIPAKR
ncbi:MAG: hypothetical protein ABIG44_02355 [Planctomycetota bacterium]